MRIDPSQPNLNQQVAGLSNKAEISSKNDIRSSNSVSSMYETEQTFNQSLKTTLKSQGKEIRKFFISMKNGTKSSDEYKKDFSKLLDSMDLDIKDKILSAPELSDFPKAQVDSYLTNIRESREIFHNVEEAYQRIA